MTNAPALPDLVTVLEQANAAAPAVRASRIAAGQTLPDVRGQQFFPQIHLSSGQTAGR